MWLTKQKGGGGGGALGEGRTGITKAKKQTSKETGKSRKAEQSNRNAQAKGQTKRNQQSQKKTTKNGAENGLRLRMSDEVVLGLCDDAIRLSCKVCAFKAFNPKQCLSVSSTISNRETHKYYHIRDQMGEMYEHILRTF